MIFADDFTPPATLSGSLADLMYIALFAAAISHLIKMWLPKPPMEKQLQDLEHRFQALFTGYEQRLMERLGEQDRQADARISKLREHLDQEVIRVHQRIDAQGRELYRLDGYVRGSNEARREIK